MKEKEKQKQLKKKTTIFGGIVIVAIIVLCVFLISFNVTKIQTINANGASINNQQERNVETETNEEENSEESEMGKVIVKYLDENGKEIANLEELTGKIGDEYATQRKDIEHYMSNGHEPLNKVGNYKKEDTTVTYTYKLVSDVIGIENKNDEITVKVKNVLKDKEYKLILEQESVEGDKLTGGKFSLTGTTNVEDYVEGTTQNGKLTLGMVNASDDKDDEYVIFEKQAPKGYSNALQSYGASIKLSKFYNNNLNTYDLTATSGDKELEVNVDDDNEEILLKVKNDMVKEYDLAVKTFASSIEGKDTKRDVQAKVDKEGQIIYEEKEDNLQVRDNEKIIYTIRVYNDANQDMEGTTIIEELPKGLKFLEDSEINKENGWSVVDQKLTTDKIKGKTIKGINTSEETEVKYEEIKLEVQVIQDEADDSNVLTNVTSIPVNDLEINKDNNTSSETVNLVRIPDIYDVSIKKFAKQVDNKDTKRSVTAKLNNLNQIVYDEVTDDTQIKDGQKIVYTIRIYNEGNKDVKGTKITDVAQKGLTLVENSEINEKYKWTQNGDNIETTYLEDKTIKGINTYKGELPNYEELYIEFTLNESELEKDTEEVINTVTIDKVDGETDIEDNQAVEKVSYNKPKTPEPPIPPEQPEEQKVFDLSMKKFLYSVDGEKLENREVKTKIEDGKINYIKNSEVYKVANNQRLVFTLRVYNEGDKKTLGRTVIENLPKGFDYVVDSEINKNNGWKMYKQDETGKLVETTNEKEVQTLKSDILTSQEIDGFEINKKETPKYKDVQIELIVNENEIDSNNKIVTNVANIENTRLEPNSDNDKDEEKVYVKLFDLEITKYIKSITIKDKSKEDVTEVGLENKGKIVKKEIDRKKIGETKVYVTYRLMVKNIGEIPGYATQLLDYTPEDFELVDNEQIWKVDGKVVTSDYLKNKIINPGEYKIVEVTFKWNLDENNLGERTNKAIISTYSNDYDAKDRTPDKNNEETFIISIRTGAYAISIVLMLVVLICIAIIIKIKLKKMK